MVLGLTERDGVQDRIDGVYFPVRHSTGGIRIWWTRHGGRISADSVFSLDNTEAERIILNYLRSTSEGSTGKCTI